MKLWKKHFAETRFLLILRRLATVSAASAFSGLLEISNSSKLVKTSAI